MVVSLINESIISSNDVVAQLVFVFALQTEVRTFTETSGKDQHG